MNVFYGLELNWLGGMAMRVGRQVGVCGACIPFAVKFYLLVSSLVIRYIHVVGYLLPFFSVHMLQHISLLKMC